MSKKRATKKSTNKNFVDRGNRLAMWCESQGWTKVEFARRMGIWPQNVSKYFAGHLDASNLVAPLIKEGCDIYWLVEGKPISELKTKIAEPQTEYGSKKTNTSENNNSTAKLRIKKLEKLVELGTEKTDEEMIDLLIKSMEERHKL